MNLKRLSKTLALALRHHPERYGITLDEKGWASTTDLLAGLGRKHPNQYGEVSESDLAAAIAASEKPRYEMRRGQIRALHGHSTQQKIVMTPQEPPAVLYHGTPAAALPQIMDNGLKPMRRQYVHLSTDAALALNVGDRKRDETILLHIDALRAAKDGVIFYRSSDVVWLADAVPPQYIQPQSEQ